MVERQRFLAVRFDIDSVTCLERGVPRLLDLGRRLGVRFTFFANLGTSFNLRMKVRSMLGGKKAAASGPTAEKLGLVEKLTWTGVFKTVVLNPRLGTKYCHVLERIRQDGHELGLHGGTDHALWQHGVRGMGEEEVRALLFPAYEEFVRHFGRPAGFACPGFQYSSGVFSLLDALGFAYSSDLAGEVPFPTILDGESFRLWQVPVNVVGRGGVPLIEQGLACGMNPQRIVESARSEIDRHEYAHIYGHPYVEGVRDSILESILRGVMDRCEIVPLSTYLDQWRKSHAE